MSFHLRIVLASIMLHAVACHAAQENPGQVDEVDRILFVGNSYTKKMSRIFGDMVAARNRNTAIKVISPGGKKLSDHLKNQETLNTIRTGDWDVVVLQEQSQVPAYDNFRPSFYASAKGLDHIIKESGARTVFYMTWGRRDGDKMNLSVCPDYLTMQGKLSEAYTHIAGDLGADVAPVGHVWKKIHEQRKDLWRQLYAKDGSHPSDLGAYLVAYVFYATLLDRNPEDVTVGTKGLSDKDRQFLVSTAREVCR